ncbi:MAG: hypothetical protein KF694_00860 [Mesorhizobium sp.]|nr:hypothetical protein [Mesorhizobium sp.]
MPSWTETEVFLAASLVVNAFLAYCLYAVSWSLTAKGLTFIAALVFNALLFPVNVNSLSSEYFGYKIDIRLCRLLGTCGSMPAAGPGEPTHPFPVGGVDLVQVCRMGLNAGYDGWSDGFEFRSYVAEAKRRLKSIDDCRMVLGLPKLADEVAERKRIEEEQRIKSLDRASLCAEALDEVGGEWDLSDAAWGAVKEAQGRGYSRESCLMAMGRTNPGGSAGGLPGWPSQNSATPSFPTGYIRNAKSTFANLRENPGTSSRIVMRLANGTEVVLLGTKASPMTGHAYCRVLTNAGVPGYVDHELVDGNCFLNAAQTSYLVAAERQEKMEAFRLFRDIAVVGLGLALTRK